MAHAAKAACAAAFVSFASCAIAADSVPAGTAASAPLSASLIKQTSTGPVQKPWGLFGLPGKPETPTTDIHAEAIDGKLALTVRTESSYGNAVFAWGGSAAAQALQGTASAPTSLHLSWAWRLDEGLRTSDLSKKSGDDVALKLCVLFDMPLDKLSWAERTYIRLARSNLRQPIPSASICYVWDRTLPVGTRLPNAFTQRLHYVVVDTGPATKRWTPHRVDVVADFFKIFGSETTELPPIIGIAVGGDADNTQGRSVGYVADLVVSSK